MGVSNGRYHSFLIRVWARKGQFVHGEVTDAATRESVRFREFPRLLRFIRAGVRGKDDDAPGEAEEVLTVLPVRGEIADISPLLDLGEPKP
jgi:hypothetical protein